MIPKFLKNRWPDSVYHNNHLFISGVSFCYGLSCDREIRGSVAITWAVDNSVVGVDSDSYNLGAADSRLLLVGT